MQPDSSSSDSSHPTKDIQGVLSTKLKGKTICLCLTGSVAVINVPTIARDLIRHGAEVICVMTKAATELIQPQLLEWSTGNHVVTNLTGAIEHVALAGLRPNIKGKADLILVCPATGNTISKIAHGIDDTPVTTVCTTAIGSNTPIIIVPAMHESMYNSPILIENIQKLKKFNIQFIGPRIVENKAKMSTPEEIVDFVLNFLSSKKDLSNYNFIVTAGPSREYLDSVRFISNPSSGKMGIALTQEILSRGGNVTLIKGPSTIDAPTGAKLINVISAQDFVDTIKTELNQKKYQVLISSAAIGDFTPVDVKNDKISSSNEELVVHLKRTPKLIDEARLLDKNLFIVAFKAETIFEEQKLVNKAIDRLVSASSNMIVANNVASKNTGRGFNTDTNEVWVIDQSKQIHHLNLASKREIASNVLDLILEKLN